MPPKILPPEAMSAEEKFNALANLKDKLEDAKEALSDAYENVTPENVHNNAAMLEFESTYWYGVKLSTQFFFLQSKISESCKICLHQLNCFHPP